MKTLDEVIKALEENPVPMAYTAKVAVQEEDLFDALSYLKMYRSDQLQWGADRKAYKAERQKELEAARKARERYVALVKELKKQDRQKWISVSDRMPETDEIVAIRCVTKKGVVTWNRAYWDGKFWHGSGSFAGVTHWMRIGTEVEE